MYRADKLIDPLGPFAICPECGYKHPFLQLPLLIVSGASGTGKTTVCQRLLGQVMQAVLLECDILWRPAWRGTQEAAYIEESCRFNRWFKAYDGQPIIKRIDITDRHIDVTALQVPSWIDESIRLHD